MRKNRRLKESVLYKRKLNILELIHEHGNIFVFRDSYMNIDLTQIRQDDKSS